MQVTIKLEIFATDWSNGNMYLLKNEDGNIPQETLSNNDISILDTLYSMIAKYSTITPSFFSFNIKMAHKQGDRVSIIYNASMPYDTRLKRGKFELHQKGQL